MSKANGKRFFYGWVVAAGLFLIAFLPMTFMNTFFSYYQVPVCAAFNVSYAQFNVANVCSSLGAMVFSIAMSSKVTKGNIRIWMLGGGLVSAACYFSMGFTTAIWQIYILAFAAVFSLSTITYIPINYLISQWFIDKKGLITSIVFAGTGLGGICFSTAFAGVFETSGWQAAFKVEAAVIAFSVVAVFFLIRKSPAEMGLKPYTSPQKAANNAPATKIAQGTVSANGLSKAQALKTLAFWLYVVSMLSIGIASAGIITQLPAYLTDNAINYAVVMAVASASGIVAKLLLGFIIDKAGVVNGMLFGCTIGIAGLVLLIFVPQAGIAAAFAAAALIPIGTNLAYIAPPLLTSALFGYKDFGGIYGFGNAFFMAGCMAGPMLSSGICTAVGSYIPAWIVLCTVFALTWLAALLAFASIKKAK